MPNWLTKATGGGARGKREAPQSFQLTCECSQDHTGQRLNRPQRIVCQNCGTALFVLPRNTYPAPRTRPAAGSSRKPRARSAPVPGIAPNLPSAAQVASSVRRGVAGTVNGVGRGVHTSVTRTGQWIGGTITSAARALREFFSPFRLVVCAMVLMLLGTAAIAIRSRMMESAREMLRSELEAGQTALVEADYVAARGHFARAAAAVERLGSDDAQSQLVQQLYRETSAITHLAPGSLFDMLEEAQQERARPGTASWEDIFRVRYEGAWLVLQTPVQRDAEGWIVDLPLTVGPDRQSVIVRADLPAFDRLPASEGATPVVFAAPIAACHLDAAAKQWLITLDGDAGFLWSTLENLRPIGLLDDEWTSEQEIASLLEQQSRVAGGAP